MAIGFHELRAERRFQFLTRWRDSLLARLRGEAGGDFEFLSLLDLAESTKRGPEQFSGGLSSDDLTGLLADVIGARFLDFSRAANPTFRALSRRVSFRSFREERWVSFEFPNLLPTNELGEVKVGALVDRSEPVVVQTFARISNLSREALVDDDVNALDSIPAQAARAAVARQNQLFWDVVTAADGAGPVTRDGERFFSAAHGNLAPTTALSEGALLEAMRLLREQRDDGGNELNLEPAALVVEPGDELEGRKLLETAGLTGQLRLLVEARARGFGFYLFASPSRFPAFIRGSIGDDEPRFVARSAFAAGQSFEGIAFKVATDFGVGAGDWRGAVRTPTSA